MLLPISLFLPEGVTVLNHPASPPLTQGGVCTVSVPRDPLHVPRHIAITPTRVKSSDYPASLSLVKTMSDDYFFTFSHRHTIEMVAHA